MSRNCLAPTGSSLIVGFPLSRLHRGCYYISLADDVQFCHCSFRRETVSAERRRHQ